MSRGKLSHLAHRKWEAAARTNRYVKLCVLERAEDDHADAALQNEQRATDDGANGGREHDIHRDTKVRDDRLCQFENIPDKRTDEEQHKERADARGQHNVVADVSDDRPIVRIICSLEAKAVGEDDEFISSGCTEGRQVDHSILSEHVDAKHYQEEEDAPLGPEENLTEDLGSRRLSIVISFEIGSQPTAPI